MNKADLVEHVADELDTTKAAAARAIDAVFDGITRAVKRGEDVRLIGFGTFSVRKRAAARGRNPKTGDAIPIPASWTVRFRAGAMLKAVVNTGK